MDFRHSTTCGRCIGDKSRDWFSAVNGTDNEQWWLERYEGPSRLTTQHWSSIYFSCHLCWAVSYHQESTFWWTIFDFSIQSIMRRETRDMHSFRKRTCFRQRLIIDAIDFYVASKLLEWVFRRTMCDCSFPTNEPISLANCVRRTCTKVHWASCCCQPLALANAMECMRSNPCNE